MTRPIRLVWLPMVLAVPLASSSAQTVRGVAREQASGTPLSGVLMSLLPYNDSAGVVATALSTDRGTYVLRAPQPGRYRLGAKRIGVRRFESEVFELAASQDVERNVELEALAYSLPTVTVQGDPLCVRRADQAGRIASLWEEARTALTATQVSLRDRLVRARVVRYVHELDAQSLRVEAERMRRQTDGVVERPFVSQSGEALSRGGYWRVLPNDSITYYAPDADVLLSATFARDHCFAVAEGRGDQAGWTGISFEPVAGREVPDVRGTLWLDARTFELRLVEFRYSRLPVATTNRHIGGEVRFAKLPTGAWIVERWFIRMPRYGDKPTTRSTGVPGQRPIVTYPLTRLIEEGGTVTVDTTARPPSR
ncbi:MAG TPA: carboxypeptidase-like regulatory domain-containing protein [Gemmatimonadaceae bacterium]|nr:carboxypeptidase-like regulatory domain-containing protein [Gemmatimonadaceae bacterium]